MAKIILAWLVHLYTALGIVIGFFTLLAIEQGNFREALYLMALSIAIDATDGTLARAARVHEMIPWFDGTLLDNIVDYFTYVVVPCYFMLRAELLPPADTAWLVCLPLLASAYGFCQRDAKTADYFFLGFPSYWNIVAFYFYALQTPLWINAFTVIGLSLLVFLPIKFIYPSRAPRFRVQTNILGALWGAILLYAIYRLPETPQGLLFASLLYPAYYTALSLWLQLRSLAIQQQG